MSLKLVDLNAERPNTGAALSTWQGRALIKTHSTDVVFRPAASARPYEHEHSP